jgi:hypothetical protein
MAKSAEIPAMDDIFSTIMDNLNPDTNINIHAYQFNSPSYPRKY